MKKYLSQIQFFNFLTVVFFLAACNGQVKNDLPEEKEHSKRVETMKWQYSGWRAGQSCCPWV